MDLLATFSIQQIFSVLVDSLNSRNFGKWSMVMGTIEGEWLKADRDPETYEASLEALNER